MVDDQFNVVIYDRALTAAQVAATPTLQASLPAVTYAYDQASNLTKTVDGRGNSWLATYNSWNLFQDRIEPSTTAHPAVASLWEQLVIYMDVDAFQPISIEGTDRSVRYLEPFVAGGEPFEFPTKQCVEFVVPV